MDLSQKGGRAEEPAEEGEGVVGGVLPAGGGGGWCSYWKLGGAVSNFHNMTGIHLFWYLSP